MLAKILGWFLLLAGIFFLIKPEILKKRLQKKVTKKLKRFLFSITIFIGFLFISAAWKSQGFLSKLLMVLGIIALLKAFIFIKTKAAQGLIEWIALRPLVFFRFAAFLYILLGLLILLG